VIRHLPRLLLPVLVASFSVRGTAVNAAAPDVGEKRTTAILVDKRLNQLHVTEYVDGSYKIIKTYHATTGKVKGDKEVEGDLKTPEGIYVANARLTPPAIKAKFGALAFYLNFPNTFDELAARTGNNIMLHATDTPDRLKQDFDSEGCVVVNNHEIREIDPQIRLGLTPVLIFPDSPGLTDEYMHPGKNPKLRSFFERWIRAWESEDIEGYISSYHSDFSAQGMDRARWKAFKANLNSKYASISIGPEAVRYYAHPKYSMVTFTQNYRSTLKGGGRGHVSRGTKILFVAEESGQPKIIAETYTQLMW